MAAWGNNLAPKALRRFPWKWVIRCGGFVTYIQFPPNHPAISIRRYLEKQEQQTVDSITVETHDPASQLRFSAHIEGDLAGLRQRLAQGGHWRQNDCS